MNWPRTILRMSVLPMGLILVSVVAAFLVRHAGFHESPALPGAASLIFALGTLAALLICRGRWQTVNRWKSGIGPKCMHCGGPLREAADRTSLASAEGHEKTCWNCGRRSPSAA